MLIIPFINQYHQQVHFIFSVAFVASFVSPIAPQCVTIFIVLLTRFYCRVYIIGALSIVSIIIYCVLFTAGTEFIVIGMCSNPFL